MSDPGELYAFDADIQRSRMCVIAGLDEAGRGPLAGPVVAAAVVLASSKKIIGVNDSKKLSAQKRDEIFLEIINHAEAYAIGEATREEIDKHNILNASLLAMHRALLALPPIWSLALIDGNQNIQQLDLKKQQYVVKGDAKSASIAAASIVAKVTRDRIMINYHNQYPEFEFNIHKGYPTPLHIKVLKEKGMTPLHRRSFCMKFVCQTTLDI